MKVTPVMAALLVAGLLRVIVMVDGTLTTTVLGEKLFATAGGRMTKMLPDAAELAGAWVVVTVLIVLVSVPPVVVPVTPTVMVQVVPAGIVPPDSAAEPAPTAAVTVPAHPAAMLAALKAPAVVLTSPPGYGSLKAAPVRLKALGFAMLIVMVELLPAMTDDGAKLLVTVGGCGPFRFAVAATRFAPELVVVRPPAAIVLA